MDGEGALAHRLQTIWDEEFVFVFQGDISHGACHDAIDINGDNFPGAIFLHAMEHCTGLESIFGETTCLLNQRAYRGSAIEIVHTGMEHATFHGDRVLITLLDGVDNH